ncbi:hypothetical protein DL95DRAFT_494527 [Leptodontidium sp. 2 PMI_412]|nr:hypothetical protein DL95DRAFT_494527 [Leptodontidium sp. 2 PMI_412]
MSTPSTFVAVAGAAGNLGSLIALNLRKRNIAVKALVRPGTTASRTQTLRDADVIIIEVDMKDVPALTEILQGATTVVSALQGLRDVILGVRKLFESKGQSFHSLRLLADFTKCAPGSNRNLDLRREFHTKLDASDIQWTSILNGAFMGLVTSGQIPLINEKWQKIMYFGSADQKLDVTTVPDTAAYTAAVAADPNPTPKILRIAGDSFTAHALAALVTRLRGETYAPMWTGSVGFLRMFISIVKLVIGGVETKPMPPWQGMQYLENMVSGKGKLDPLDNDRYPELAWTTIEMALKDADAEKAATKSKST